MKKLLALVSVLYLMTVCTAFADGEIELDSTVTTGTTTVTMNMDSVVDNYTFTIPASVSIDPVTQYGYGTVSLKAGWELNAANGVEIAIASAANQVNNIYNSGYALEDASAQIFTLVDAEGNKVKYGIRADGISSTYALSGSNTSKYYYKKPLISVLKGGDNQEDILCALTFYVRTAPANGVYSDTLTFAVTTK